MEVELKESRKINLIRKRVWEKVPPIIVMFFKTETRNFANFSLCQIQNYLSKVFNHLCNTYTSEYSAYLHGVIKEHGKLYISSNYISFYAKVFGKQTKVILSHLFNLFSYPLIFKKLLEKSQKREY